VIAWIGRGAAFLYIAFYAVTDHIAGIGTGGVMQQSGASSTSERPEIGMAGSTTMVETAPPRRSKGTPERPAVHGSQASPTYDDAAAMRPVPPRMPDGGPYPSDP
jgi:hypothetical protein